MTREENVAKSYAQYIKLKSLIRTGWKDWNVKRDRLESVAEHVYGAQMLAILMYSEFEYKIDIQKVIMMLSIHEMEEIKIGDLTWLQISREDKAQLGHEAVENLLSSLKIKNELKALILEFDERKTPEANFAYQCDKLECDLQAKLYDEEGCVDLNDQDGNKTMENSEVQQLLKTEVSFSGMWLTFGQKKYPYDENFLRVSQFAKKHRITD